MLLSFLLAYASAVKQTLFFVLSTVRNICYILFCIQACIFVCFCVVFNNLRSFVKFVRRGSVFLGHGAQRPLLLPMEVMMRNRGAHDGRLSRRSNGN